MRIYNITTESKFKGMYISEVDCNTFIYNTCYYANIPTLQQITMIGNYARHVLQELYNIEPHVVITLGTVKHGNQNCVRLSALSSILAQLLKLEDEEVMKIAYDMVEEWEDVEIEIGEEN